MREIKFRGIDKYGNWTYGLLSIGQDSFLITERHDVPPSMSDPCGDVVVTYERVSHDTVGQYTGLKDKTGKEIYEGDILNSKNDGSDGHDVWDYGTHVNLFVKWNNKYACFESLPDQSEMSVHSYARIEIIGNIHENPELLTTAI